MLKNEQIVSSTKRCAHVISGFKQLLAKVTYDEPLIWYYTVCLYCNIHEFMWYIEILYQYHVKHVNFYY